MRPDYLRESPLPEVILTVSSSATILSLMNRIEPLAPRPGPPQPQATTIEPISKVEPPALPASLPALTTAEIDAARAYVDASRALSPQRAYEADWRRFVLWCRQRATAALPASPALVAVYLRSWPTVASLRPRSPARWPPSPTFTGAPVTCRRRARRTAW